MGNYSFPPAIKQPSIIPYLVAGPNAPEFVKECESVIDSEFDKNTHLKVLKLREINGVQTMIGSNSLILPVVQRVAPNYRTGRPEDIQKTLNDGDTLSIKGNHYVDMGVVLDFTGRHHEMALDFYNQLPKELQDFERLPAVVVGYGLKNFNEGNYSLGLIMNDGTQVRPAKILAGRRGKFSDADVSLETGLPSRLTDGNRTLYTATQNVPSLDNLGLSRLNLNGNLYVDLDVVGLADSYEVGRVVLF